MAQRRVLSTTLDSARLDALEERLARMQALLDQQQTLIDETQRQSEDVTLRPAGTPDEGNQQALAHPSETTTRGAGREGRASSRRDLLKWGGAAAAAATVAMVTSVEAANAAPADDNANLVIGTANTGTSETSLTATGSSSTATFFAVDVSSSTNSNATAISGTAMIGSPGTGVGIFGSSQRGRGVYGTSMGGIAYGVYGENTGAGGGTGVYGTSLNGPAVVGSSGAVQDLVAAGTGRILQNLQSSAGAPTSNSTSYSKGEMIRDSNGDLWLCTATGAPGTWVRAAHVPNGYSGGGTVVLSQGIRLLDTRGNDDLAKNQGGGPYNPAGSPYHLSVAGVNWQGVTVPGSAVAAIGLVTAVPSPSGGGYIAIVPQGTGFSGTASLAYNAGLISGASFTVGLSGGAMDIIIGGYPTDVVIDLFAVIA